MNNGWVSDEVDINVYVYGVAIYNMSMYITCIGKLTEALICCVYIQVITSYFLAIVDKNNLVSIIVHVVTH